MRVLLDENLPHKLRQGLVGHQVSTVGYMGWSGLKNGALLQVAEVNGFEVLVTGDQSLRYQQDIPSRKMSLVILSAIQWELIKNHMREIDVAIECSVTGSFREVECGRYVKRQRKDGSGGL